MAIDSGPGPSIGSSALLTGALEFAWYRHCASAGTHHVLLALVARGDPVSAGVLAQAGITYSAVCDVLNGPQEWRDADSGSAMGTNNSHAAKILANAAATVRPPGRIARMLRMSPWMPRWPAPSWTPSVIVMIEDAVRLAQSGGRRKLCRADLIVTLLSQENSAATEVLALLEVGHEQLLHRVLELFGASGPGPVGADDLDIRPIGWVLGSMLKSGNCSMPGQWDSAAWRFGMNRMVRVKFTEISAELPLSTDHAEHVVLAILATYEELAGNSEHFGPGWEKCFPAGRALSGYGITYERARRTLLDLAHEDHGRSGEDTTDMDSGVHQILDAEASTISLLMGGFAELTTATPLHTDGLREAARLLGHRPKLGMGPEIDLLGAIHESNTLANRLLDGLGVDKDQLRQTLIDTLQ